MLTRRLRPLCAFAAFLAVVAGALAGAPAAQAYPVDFNSPSADLSAAPAYQPSAVISAAPAYRVGLQVGHWHISQLPASLARLRGDTGTAGGGRSEVQYNLDMANRTAAILRAQGVLVDILPATVPTGYRADAFVAIHADGNVSAWARGYKIATRWRSSAAFRDAVLVDSLSAAYGPATGLPRDASITRNMRGYYAFNTWFGDESRISNLTPAAIIETGYLTNAADRAVLFYHPDAVAAGIARGILNFLHNTSATAVQAHAAAVAAASPTRWGVVVLQDGTHIHATASLSSPVIATVNRGDSLAYLDNTIRPHGPFTNLHGTQLAAGIGTYRVAVPGRSTPGYISRDLVVVQLPSP